MSKGPLAISIQVHGCIEAGQAIKRSTAKVGDQIYVSGVLGEAALALKMFSKQLGGLNPLDEKALNQAFYQPQPRIELGAAGLGLVSAAIDVSDGLLADVGHIARQSGVGIIIESYKVPVAPVVQRLVDAPDALNYALCGGDDYELAWAVSASRASQLEAIADGLNVPLTGIGKVVEGAGVSCVNRDGDELVLASTGYTHFS